MSKTLLSDIKSMLDYLSMPSDTVFIDAHGQVDMINWLMRKANWMSEYDTKVLSYNINRCVNHTLIIDLENKSAKSKFILENGEDLAVINYDGIMDLDDYFLDLVKSYLYKKCLYSRIESVYELRFDSLKKEACEYLSSIGIKED